MQRAKLEAQRPEPPIKDWHSRPPAVPLIKKDSIRGQISGSTISMQLIADQWHPLAVAAVRWLSSSPYALSADHPLETDTNAFQHDHSYDNLPLGNSGTPQAADRLLTIPL